MGNWNINIQGIGCHHNENNPTDADLLAAHFVADLKNAGHTIEAASFTCGAKTDLLGVIALGGIGPDTKNNETAEQAPTVHGASLLLGLLLLTFGASAAETNAPPKAAPPAKVEESLFGADTITVAGFRSVRVSDHEERHGRFGTGAEIGYALTKDWTLAGEFITESPHSGDVDELGLNLKYYVPLKKSLAAYGLLGVTYSFDEETLAGETTRDRQWRMNLGAGLEVRAAKHVGLFADGRWTHNFDDVGNGLFRLGLNIRF